MTEYRLERECRTPYSEAYLIVAGDDRVGRVDMHYTPSIVYATLCVEEKITGEGIQELIDQVDEELVMSADPNLRARNISASETPPSVPSCPVGSAAREASPVSARRNS